jgi:undecaprenyl-diphosphatase
MVTAVSPMADDDTTNGPGRRAEGRSMRLSPRTWVVRGGVLLVAWAGLTGILIAAGAGVVHSSTIVAFDHHVTTTVVHHRTSALNSAMKLVTWLGSWVALVAAAVVVLALALRRRLPWLAVAAAVVLWGGEAGGVALTKRVVQRPRPPSDIRLVTAHGWSWPSGHTATAVVVFSVLAITVGRLSGSTLLRVVAWAGALMAVLAVGFSRIELGVHWTTDVIASVVYTSSWLAIVLAATAFALRPTESALQ